MSGSKQKKQRLEKIEEQINQEENGESKETVVAQLIYNWGTSRRKALEYIDTLVRLGKVTQVEEEDETVLYPEDYSETGGEK